jgi:branched-chain amino acid transport system permease protein
MMNTLKRKEMNTSQRFYDLIPFSPLGALGLVVLAILPLVPPFNQEYLLQWLIIAAIIGGQAIAFDFTAGFINIINFGFAAFVGLGAYTSALMAIHFGLSPWITMFTGALSAGLLGLFTGIITLRLRGIFAVFMTWWLGLALMGLTTKMVWLTRGPLGLRCPPLFETSSNLPYFYTILVMVVVTYVVLRWIARTHMGLAFKAIGQNMEAARTSGINPTRYRIINFTISCAFAGWIGGFYAHFIGILTPHLMDTSKTVEVLAIAIIGGRGSLWGGAFVAFPFLIGMEMIKSSLSQLPGLHLVIYGLLLALIMIYYPDGVAKLHDRLFSRSSS